MNLTPKQEAFCLAYIETGNATAADRQAYSFENMKPETENRKAKELTDNGKISARISELQKTHQKRHNVTVDSLVADLEAVSKLAVEKAQCSAAVNAIMGQAKLLGKLTDKVQHSGTIDFSTSHEWAVVRATVLLALKPYPSALKAVSDSLRTLESRNG